MGSLEFACEAKGAKVIVVLGHTDCSAVSSACQLHLAGQSIQSLTRMPHIQYVLGPLNESVSRVAELMQPQNAESGIFRASDANECALQHPLYFAK